MTILGIEQKLFIIYGASASGKTLIGKNSCLCDIDLFKFAKIQSYLDFIQSIKFVVTEWI